MVAGTTTLLGWAGLGGFGTTTFSSPLPDLETSWNLHQLPKQGLEVITRLHTGCHIAQGLCVELWEPCTNRWA